MAASLKPYIPFDISKKVYPQESKKSGVIVLEHHFMWDILTLNAHVLINLHSCDLHDFDSPIGLPILFARDLIKI